VKTVKASVIDARPAAHRGTAAFFRHYLEMVVVMLVSMVLVGAVVSAVFAVLGHANLYHYAAFRAFVMSANMTVGMVLWMRIRGHGWITSLEMAAAMIAPFVLLVGPYRTGIISAGVLLIGTHVLMLPLMAIAMLHRYGEYADGKHQERAFARFNRLVANPLVKVIAGRVPPIALITHKGRRTGTPYTTPAWGFRTEDGLIFAVLYGADSDWVRNVLAANGATVHNSGRISSYSSARLVDRSEGLELIPRATRFAFRLLRVRHFLRVRKVVSTEALTKP
jgi:deazaflavin-dependent oxidoreductase (nitroreductase family)